MGSSVSMTISSQRPITIRSFSESKNSEVFHHISEFVTKFCEKIKERNFRAFLWTRVKGLGLVVPRPSFFAGPNTILRSCWIFRKKRKKDFEILSGSLSNTHSQESTKVSVCVRLNTAQEEKECVCVFDRPLWGAFSRQSKAGHEKAVDTYQNLPQGFRT
jgi:hypothetical protein